MNKRALLNIMIIGTLGLFFIFCPFQTVLTLESSSGSPALCFLVQPGDELTISFVHSVNKRPVYDTLRIEQDHFLVVKSRYEAFGAGMPETSSGDYQLKTAADGRLELTGINLRLNSFTVFVGTVADHALQIHNQNFRMTDFVAPGTPIAFSLNKFSPYQVWKGGCTH